MKKLIFSLFSLLLSTYAFCQERFLHFRAIDKIEFLSLDNLYALWDNDTFIFRDASRSIYHKFILNSTGGEEYESDMVISENNLYHSCGSRPCKEDNIILDDKMKLFFEENSKINNSSPRDHGLHRSHYSSK